MSNLPLAGRNTSNDASVGSFYQGYYKTDIPVSGAVYDAVLTFFLRRTNGDRTAAEALTSSVMVIALNRGIEPMSIIDDFKKLQDDAAFKAAIVSFLNSDRRPTSKLGYAATPLVNEYVVRNIGS